MPRLDQRRVITLLITALLLTAIAYPLWLVFRQSAQVGGGDSGFTLRWYGDLFDSRTAEVLKNTIVIVVCAASLALVTSVVLAWLIERVEIPSRRVAAVIPLAALLVPPLVGAAAWIFLLSGSAGYLNVLFRAVTGSGASEGPLDIYSRWGVIFVTTIYVVPFTYTVVHPALVSMSSSLEEAAYISGAGPFTAARTVTLGVLRPALLGALILAFVSSVSQFTIPLLLSRGEMEVLTTEIYHQMTSYPPGHGAATALSMCAVVPSLLLLALQYRLLRRGGYSVIGGKGGSTKRIRTRWIRWLAMTVIGTYCLVAVVLPIGALVLVSLSPFWDGRVHLSTMGLLNYRFLFDEYGGTVPSISSSVKLGAIGAVSASILAFVVAYITTRSRSRMSKALDFVGSLPAGVPQTVFGVGFLFMFTRPPFLSLYNTIWVLLIAYLVLFLPQAIRATSAGIRQISVELEDAARVFGSSWLGSMKRVTLPLALPSVIAGAMLLFVILSRETAVSVFLTSPGVRVVGVTILDLWNSGQTSAVAAFSLMIVAVSIVFIVIAQAVQARGEFHGRRRRWRRAPDTTALLADALAVPHPATAAPAAAPPDTAPEPVPTGSHR